MGQNSTEVAYGFGQMGSIFNTGGNGVKVCSDAGFSDASHEVCVVRSGAWRRRSAQAGNRWDGFVGSAGVMGI